MFVVLLVIALSSQELGPPANPERFRGSAGFGYYSGTLNEFHGNFVNIVSGSVQTPYGITVNGTVFESSGKFGIEVGVGTSGAGISHSYGETTWLDDMPNDDASHRESFGAILKGIDKELSSLQGVIRVSNVFQSRTIAKALRVAREKIQKARRKLEEKPK